MPRLARMALALAWLVTLAAPATGAGHGFEAAMPVAFGTAPADPPSGASGPGPAMGSEFAVRSPLLADELLGDGLLAARGMTREPKKPKKLKAADSTAAAPPAAEAAPAKEKNSEGGGLPGALSGDRARVMLQSLTVPGWGQQTLGQTRAALAFGLVETGIWVSFASFQIQETMRRHTYEGTARLFAGIDLSGRDEEYRHVVGLYRSSDDYNIYVVRRDAANLYYGDPAGYDAYVAAHEIKGAGAWAWDSDADLLRYRDERQAAQRSTKHAQDALAAALINRLVSVVLVARSNPHPADQASWRIECAPAPGDFTAYRLAVRADF